MSLIPSPRIALAALLTLSLLPNISWGQNTKNFPHIGQVIKLDPELDQYIPTDAKIEVVASGFDWSEGPVWIPDSNSKNGGFLVFSDVPKNVVYKWEYGIGITEYLKPSGYTGLSDYSKEQGSNGLTLDNKGQMISCEHGDRRVSVLTPGGGKRTLTDNYDGKRFNSPNDCCVDKKGNVYFTDPIYGLPKGEKDPLRELDYCGVFVYKTDGTTALVTKEFERPNGVALSPDNKTLYVAQSHAPAAIIKAFPLNDDGTVGTGRVVADLSEHMGKLPGSPDGLRVDAQGTIFTSGPGGVWVIKPDGKILGRLSIGEAIGNCTFGNKDGTYLYITADMYLCRIKTLTKGQGF
jgi:gluconolactonase